MAGKYKFVTLVMMAVFAIVSIGAWIKPDDMYSVSERRALEQFPEVSLENILSGDFMSDFENYATDQFGFRDGLRKVKALFAAKVLGQKDQHDIYIVNGYASKMEYPLNESGVQRTIDRFQYIYDLYMKNAEVQIYYSIIPDKNYYLADENGYLSMDYEKLFMMLNEGMDYMTKIDIAEKLSLEDYYKTDIHWRQENLLKVSGEILQAMGNTVNAEYELKTLNLPFYGVYAGQSALPLEAETIYYYSNDILENCKVYDFENAKETTVYDMDKANGKDPYEMFLSGPISLMTIENPMAESDKELILFRDSFGSSIAPLLAESYNKITLVDIRYIHPDLLGKYIEFKDQDVLFLYSTSVLNNGEIFK